MEIDFQVYEKYLNFSTIDYSSSKKIGEEEWNFYEYVTSLDQQLKEKVLTEDNEAN